jgi:hypothetical protein
VEILFNELSLTGQFDDLDDFAKNALLPFVAILKEMQNFSTLMLKKGNVWERMITQDSNLHSVLISRTSDEVRRFKSAVATLTREPFWDFDSKQDEATVYLFDGNDIKGSSPAEACERDQIVVSFISSATSCHPLYILRNGTNIPLVNLTSSGILSELLWDQKEITFESYVKTRFAGKRFDFSKVEKNMGFSDIQTQEQDLFVDTFRKVEKLTWDQIYSDDGLKYKEYHGQLSESFRGKKTYKFRASQKIRCHGYRENNLFVVIGFEVDHGMSDRG